jgi:hypothetical protein
MYVRKTDLTFDESGFYIVETVYSGGYTSYIKEYQFN